MYVYAAELMPTLQRSAGVGLCSQAARIGSAAATGLVVIAPESMSFSIFAIFGLLGAIVTELGLVETRGAPMPNTVAEAVRGSARLRAGEGEAEEHHELLAERGHEHAV